MLRGLLLRPLRQAHILCRDPRDRRSKRKIMRDKRTQNKGVKERKTKVTKRGKLKKGEIEEARKRTFSEKVHGLMKIRQLTNGD